MSKWRLDFLEKDGGWFAIAKNGKERLCCWGLTKEEAIAALKCWAGGVKG